ncbi:site-specific DNA-methyltransferase [Helicobacter mehlei]|uniref:site-specific DNA-methyltransferase (adenine-specific) n=1 Tax=Helicobacter mehlei TaxID=2316080 RepID=A0A553V305_9HELI|nr:site-specific DNA-methyltransferase [Helicobacter mehlei]TSA86611.1 site-specific DNA-methyltransferase [Helicobacter mehlei]
MRSECIFDNAPQGAQDSKLEGLKKLYPACFDQEGKLVLERLEAVLKKEGSFSSESYNLQWLGKAYARMLAEERPLSVLEIESNPPSQNVLIKGDNLEALKHLQHAYYEKIKLIYIDPPYNTGNDAFIYQDKRNFTPQDLGAKAGMSEGEARRVLDFIAKGANTHSAWLTFMFPRLVLARHLLREDGAIFISIDDNEQAPLKLLCDEIFGESNFVANLVWQKKTGSADATNIATITEYVLCYAKNQNDLQFNKNTQAHDENRYRYSDEFESTRGKYYLDNLDRGTLGGHASLDYPITCPDGSIIHPNGRSEAFNDGWRWKWGKEKFKWGLENGFIDFRKSKNGQWKVCYKIYMHVDNEGNPIKRATPFKNLLTEVMNNHATQEIQALFGLKIFDTPKPTALIQKILQIATTGGGGEPRDCPRLLCRLWHNRACGDGTKLSRWGQAAIYFNPTRRGN